MVVTLFHFPKIIPKCLTSNPLSQIVTSNSRLQPDIHLAVDMFPYKKTSFFRSLASNPNLRKSPEIRRFLALDFISLTSILPSPRAQSPGTYPRSIPSSPHTPSPAALQDLSPGWSVCRRYTPSAAHRSG